jgi:hypothetical protein
MKKSCFFFQNLVVFFFCPGAGTLLFFQAQVWGQRRNQAGPAVAARSLLDLSKPAPIPPLQPAGCSGGAIPLLYLANPF